MDLHYLKIFYEVAKAGSFTKAAEELCINQSAVSIQIKKFEKMLNTKLIDRNSKKIKLTYTGRALYKMAEEIFEKVRRTEKIITDTIESEKESLDIGVSPVIAEPILPKLIKEFSKLHNEIEYSIFVSIKKTLFTMLKEGDLDVLIVDEERERDSSLSFIDLSRTPYVLVSKKKYNKMTEVAKDALITRNTVPNNRKIIDILEKKYKIKFNNQVNVIGSLELIKSMVKTGIGNTILPHYSVYKEIESKELELVYQINEVEDSYQVVFMNDRKNDIKINKFLNFTKNYEVKKIR